ncbi:MAG: hypothetical protein GX177_07415 [Firmicutes bacterium]|mgnify:FL=1|jgi:hypothetical protein|nr:hypothetical protein [Bacillota bacterium]
MDLEIGSTRIFNCPVCSVDTPHSVRAHKGELYGIVCTNCSSGAIVHELDLRIYQLKWEEELREILDNLVEQSLGFDDD